MNCRSANERLICTNMFTLLDFGRGEEVGSGVSFDIDNRTSSLVYGLVIVNDEVRLDSCLSCW